MSKRDLLRREKARRKLLSFVDYTWAKAGGYRTNFHHEHIASSLEAVARYQLPRVIIVTPPRHGKSELVSRNFPAWYLGKNPHRQVISVTYGDALSSRMAADVRRVIATDEYKELYPGFAYGDKNANNEWNTLAGGSYYASGIRLAVTGMGANVLLVDDPVKNREEAESQLIREKTKEAFDNDFLTRLEQPNAVVLMATRWHEEDLIGQVLSGPTAGEWVILHYPRIQDRAPTKADPRVMGAPLWPGRMILPWETCPELAEWPHNCDERRLRDAARHRIDEYDDEAIERIQAQSVAREYNPDDYDLDGFFEDSATGYAESEKVPVSLEALIARDISHYEAFEANDPYGASALEQGRPTPRGATFLDADAINTYMGSPAQRALYCPEILISVDANFKKTKTSDFASLTVFGRTRAPNAIFPLDERHGRYRYPDLKRRLKELVDRWPRAAILIEAKANGQALIDELREEGLARVIAFNPEQYGSKDTRAQYAAEFVAGGGLFVPTENEAPWIRPWLDEISKYGQTDHDDRMDSFSMACIYWGVEKRKSGLEHLRRICAVTG